MSTVKLRYKGAVDQVDVPVLGREGEPYDEHGAGCLVRGEVFDCDKKLAGRPPKVDDDGALLLGDDDQPVDAGEGLLAQVANFELAEAPRRRRPAKRASRPTPPPPAADTSTDGTTPEA